MSERSLFDRDHPVFCALVNGEGEVTDFLRLPHFTKRRNAWREEEREKKVSLGAAGTEMNVGSSEQKPSSFSLIFQFLSRPRILKH